MKVGNSRDSQTSSGQVVFRLLFWVYVVCVGDGSVDREKSKNSLPLYPKVVTEMKLHYACRVQSLKIISNICALKDGLCKQVTWTFVRL